MDAENPIGCNLFFFFKNNFRYYQSPRLYQTLQTHICEYAKFIHHQKNGCAPNLHHLHFLALSLSLSFALTVFFAHSSLCFCFIIGHLLQHKLQNQWANETICVVQLWGLVLLGWICVWLDIGGCALECGGVAGQWILEFTITSVLWGLVLPLLAFSIHFQCWVCSLSLSFYVCVRVVSSCSGLDYIWIGFLVVWNLEKKDFFTVELYFVDWIWGL